MSKTDLVTYVAENAGLTKADASRAVEAVIAGVEKGCKVTITGFATFTAKKKAAKNGRNPRTGETVKIPARTAVTIKAGSKLKDALN